MRRRRWAAAIFSFCLGALASATSFADKPDLVLERTISLGRVSGRIDHMAIDLGRKRLFVSELGANSVAVVDLDSGKVIRQIDGLSEPQGIGYSPDAGVLAIANAGDGSVRLFQGDELTPTGAIAFGQSAGSGGSLERHPTGLNRGGFPNRL